MHKYLFTYVFIRCRIESILSRTTGSTFDKEKGVDAR
jgi:hypothetical protein